MKRIIAIMLSLLMLLPLVSCSKGEKQTKEVVATTTETKMSEEECENIYNLAVKCDELNAIDDAYTYYCQLPDDYKDVKEKKEFLEPYVGICGTWVCDGQLFKSTNGIEYRPLFSEGVISVDSRSDQGFTFVFKGKTTTVDQNHICFNRFDMWMTMKHDSEWLMSSDLTVEPDGTKEYKRSVSMSSSDSGSLYTQYSFAPDGTLTMTVQFKNNANQIVVDVAFPYTKKA